MSSNANSASKSDADIRKAKDLFREILLAKEGGNKELENQKAMELFDLILQAEADRHRRQIFRALRIVT